MTKTGFKLERGDTEDNKHIKMSDLKQITNYELQKYEKETIKLEKEIETEDIEILKQEYKRIIKKVNKLSKQYTRIKIINNTNLKNYEKMQENAVKIEKDNKLLKMDIKNLEKYINNCFECFSVLSNVKIEQLKNIINNLIKENDNNEQYK